MSCACEIRKLMSELDRVRRLAKAMAKAEEQTYVIYKKTDGSYGFCPATDEITAPIVEYVSKH